MALGAMILFKNTLIFILGCTITGMFLGGVMWLFPTLVIKKFGKKYYGINYGLVYVGYSIAGLIAPKLSVSIVDGRYTNISLLYGICLVVCLLASVTLHSNKITHWN